MNNTVPQQPFISIITPVYNRADCIKRCIKSVSTQTCTAPFEHIVVDDGSTDGTFEITTSLTAENKHLKALRLDHNSGPNAARNAAVKAATGKFILLLDSDDTIDKGALQMIVDTVVKHPKTKHFLFAADDRKDHYTSQGYKEGDTAIFTFRDFLENKVSGDFAHLIRRDTMLKYTFDERLRIFENIFFLSFYKEAENILFVNHSVLKRDRARNDRVSYSLIASNQASLRRHIDAIKLYIDRFHTDLMETEAGQNELANNLLKRHKFAIMLGNYDDAKLALNELGKLGITPPTFYTTLGHLHAGPLFFQCARWYIKLKYLIKRPE